MRVLLAAALVVGAIAEGGAAKAAAGGGGRVASAKQKAYNKGFVAGRKFGAEFSKLDKTERAAKAQDFGEKVFGDSVKAALTEDEKAELKTCMEEFLGAQKDAAGAEAKLNKGIEGFGEDLVEVCGKGARKIYGKIQKKRGQDRADRAKAELRRFFDGKCIVTATAGAADGPTIATDADGKEIKGRDKCGTAIVPPLDVASTGAATDSWVNPREAFRAALEADAPAVYAKYFDASGEAKEALWPLIKKLKFKAKADGSKRDDGEAVQELDTQDATDADKDDIAAIVAAFGDDASVDEIFVEVAELAAAEADLVEVAKFEQAGAADTTDGSGTDASAASPASILFAGAALFSLLL